MNRPAVGVGVVIPGPGDNRNKMLMQKRTGAHGDGQWSFPGGHIEAGEYSGVAAVREAREEVGVDIRQLRTLPLFTEDVFPETGKHYITLYVLATDWRGDPEIREPDKCSEMGWFSWGAFPSPLFQPIDQLVMLNRNPLLLRDNKLVWVNRAFGTFYE